MANILDDDEEELMPIPGTKKQRVLNTNVQILASNIDSIKEDIKDIKAVLRGSYVTQDQFGPVKLIVYGLVTLVLLSVIGTLLTIVLKQ